MVSRLQNLIEHYQHSSVLFVVAGGPSLEMVNLSLVDPEKYPVIVCNTAYRLFPNAMLAHHCDYAWWKVNANDILTTFKGQLITGAGLGYNIVDYPEQVQHLKFVQGSVLAPDAESILGANVGHQGLVLAHLFQPKTIILLGYDHRRSLTGQSHWSNATPLTQQERMDDLWKGSMKWFHKFAKQRQSDWEALGHSVPLPRIINASPISALGCFDKVERLEDALEQANLG